jgi:hypothetical protein
VSRCASSLLSRRRPSRPSLRAPSWAAARPLSRRPREFAASSASACVRARARARPGMGISAAGCHPVIHYQWHSAPTLTPRVYTCTRPVFLLRACSCSGRVRPYLGVPQCLCALPCARGCAVDGGDCRYGRTARVSACVFALEAFTTFAFASPAVLLYSIGAEGFRGGLVSSESESSSTCMRLPLHVPLVWTMLIGLSPSK